MYCICISIHSNYYCIFVFRFHQLLLLSLMGRSNSTCLIFEPFQTPSSPRVSFCVNFQYPFSRNTCKFLTSPPPSIHQAVQFKFLINFRFIGKTFFKAKKRCFKKMSLKSENMWYLKLSRVRVADPSLPHCDTLC